MSTRNSTLVRAVKETYLLQQVKKLVWTRRRRALAARGGAPAKWYDDVYASHDDYATHYKDSRYLPVWEGLCDRIPVGSSVLEVGCGPGQLAEMMLDRGAGSYVGFDFSPKAVELARERLPQCRIEVADARTTDLYKAQPYDVMVTTEVLEHITEDLEVLERVPPGVRILATVPDFPYESHVRWFDTVEQVRERYEQYFSDLEITTYHHAGDTEGSHGTFYLMNGPRR